VLALYVGLDYARARFRLSIFVSFFSFLFFLRLWFGTNWRAREGIVDVTVGRLTHGSTSQYLALCGGMTVLSALESLVGVLEPFTDTD